MSEDDYYIDGDIDGHPICFGEIIQDKKTILQDLNALSGTTRSLYKENAELKATIDKLVEALQGLTGYNTPSAYDNENDGAGHCPYCNGWNMKHYDSCSIKKAEDLINSVTDGK